MIKILINHRYWTNYSPVAWVFIPSTFVPTVNSTIAKRAIGRTTNKTAIEGGLSNN